MFGNDTENNMPATLPTIAILGGTGKEGKGLAYRWAKAGYPIIIGSRTPGKAHAAAAEIKGLLSPNSSANIGGEDNLTAAQRAEILVLTVPYTAHRVTLESIRLAAQGKLLVDVTVPLVPP